MFVEEENLLFVIFSAEEEVSCKDLLTSRDKVEIIKATFAYIAGDDGLWNRFPSSLTTLNNTVFTIQYRASCNSCYTKPVNHTSRLTETTVKFFALFASTQVSKEGKFCVLKS